MRSTESASPATLPAPILLSRREFDVLDDANDMARAQIDPPPAARRTLDIARRRLRLRRAAGQTTALDTGLCWDGENVMDLCYRLMNPRNASGLDAARHLRRAGRPAAAARLDVPEDLRTPWTRGGRRDDVLAVDRRGYGLVRVRDTVLAEDGQRRPRERIAAQPLSLIREHRTPRPDAVLAARAAADTVTMLLGQARYALWSARRPNPGETVTGRVVMITRTVVIQEHEPTRSLVIHQRADLGWNGNQETVDAMLESREAVRLVGPRRADGRDLDVLKREDCVLAAAQAV